MSIYDNCILLQHNKLTLFYNRFTSLFLNSADRVEAARDAREDVEKGRISPVPGFTLRNQRTLTGFIHYKKKSLQYF